MTPALACNYKTQASLEDVLDENYLHNLESFKHLRAITMSSSTVNTGKDAADDGHSFADLDDIAIYNDISRKVFNEDTRNFVVEFGRDDAQIVYDLSSEAFDLVLKRPRALARPVRWMYAYLQQTRLSSTDCNSNIWAPNEQTHIVDRIEKEYGFSKRLAAIMKTKPPDDIGKRHYDRSDSGTLMRMQLKEDIELGTRGRTKTDSSDRSKRLSESLASATHYDIARQMLHYHSIDKGKRCA